MITQRSLADKLRDRIRETQDAGLILPRHSQMLLEAMEENTLQFRVPQSVTVRINNRDDAEYGFDIFRCPECGRMFSFREACQMGLRCNSCRTTLTQAPVFCASYRDRPPVPLPFSESLKKVTYDQNSNYCIYTGADVKGRRLPADFKKGLREADHARPVDSLCWTCPIPEEPCNWRRRENFCAYSKYDNTQQQNWRPDKWDANLIRLVPGRGRRRTAFGAFVDRYRPITISEGITKPIKVAIHNIPEREVVDVRFHGDELPGVAQIRYSPRIEIFQFTLALAVGLPYVPIRNRAVRLLTEQAPDGEDMPYLLSRRLVTEGIVINLRRQTVQEIVERWFALRPNIQRNLLTSTLYHTVSHAFLKPLPIIAGLDVSEFYESFSPTDNEITIFDNSPGGIGGVRSALEKGSGGYQLRSDFAAQLLNSLDCQLDCVWSCKACLHSATCGWINRQLKREMLNGIIDERLRERYFVV